MAASEVKMEAPDYQEDFEDMIEVQQVQHSRPGHRVKEEVCHFLANLYYSYEVLKVGESSRVDSVLESVIQKGLRESSKMPKVCSSVLSSFQQQQNAISRPIKTLTLTIGSRLKTCRQCSRNLQRRSWRQRRRNKQRPKPKQGEAGSRTRRRSKCPTSCPSTSLLPAGKAPQRPRWLGSQRSRSECLSPHQTRLGSLACRLSITSSIALSLHKMLRAPWVRWLVWQDWVRIH